MKTQTQTVPNAIYQKVGSAEILAGVWLVGAILLTFLGTSILQGAFPIFTFVMLVVVLVALLRKRDAAQIGICAIHWTALAKYALINLGGSLALMAIFEPWSHTYQTLLGAALSSAHIDTTFGWLVRFPGAVGWAGFVLFAGLVTLFAEEIFFRGWLLQGLKRRMSEGKAILLQAALMTLPQMLAALLLPRTQGILYAVVYSFLAIGLIGGWAASRTQSIWPSLVSATLYNLVMVVMVF
jgi:membrane protease YdiL (CAAX protease family)